MITTLVLLFGFAPVLSVFLTPAVRALGIKDGCDGYPDRAQNTHKTNTANRRVGCFLSFAITGLTAVKF